MQQAKSEDGATVERKTFRRPKHIPPALATLVEDAAAAFYVEATDVFLDTREKASTAARHVVMWAMRTTWKPQPSFPDIGRMLGYDHTTVMSAVRRIDEAISKQTDIGQAAQRVAWGQASVRRVPGEGLVLETGGET